MACNRQIAGAWARVARLVPTVLACGLGGCATLGYYGQTVGGHVEVLHRRVPIEQAIASPATPADTRERLRLVEGIRQFAARELGLPDNGSYRSYADLERPYVLWNVFAAPEFELALVPSCFPFVGCLGYRGYYAEAAAQAQARKLHGRGLDVYVGGVSAYSTLGWFDDPVLSTMLRWSDTELAGVIIHELAHQRLYVRDDTAYNESFATAVQEAGVERWLAERGDAELAATAETERRRRTDFLKLVDATRARLLQLYGSGQSPEQMRASKALAFEEMRAEYERLKQSWGGYAGYDGWFGADLNNAKLMAVATYTEWAPAFRRLLVAMEDDFPRFYAAAERAAALPPDERRRWLEGWRAAGVGGY